MPAPDEQIAAEADVQAALQNLVGKGYESASLTVMRKVPGGTPNPVKGPQQTHREHTIAVSGTLDKSGTVVVRGAAKNPVNQPLPLSTPSPAPAAAS